MAKREAKTDAVQLTVVIGTLNRPKIVSQLLKQLVNESRQLLFEVLVFDQSNSQNYRKLKNDFPSQTNFRLFHLDTPNTCHYLNLGWQKSQAPVVLYLDDDVILTSHTLSGHLKAYDNKQVKGVAGRVINQPETTEPGRGVGKISFFGALIVKRFFDQTKQWVDFPYGCNMSFRTDVLKELGGFDEKLKPPIYAYNEVDLGVRLNQRFPKSLIFEPKALVTHLRHFLGGTRTYDQGAINKSSQHNYGYFLAKNYSWHQNLIALARRLAFQIIKEPFQIPAIFSGFLLGKSKTQYFNLLAFVGLLTLAVFFRFWNLGQFFTFNFDEEYQALLAWEQVKNPHLIWIGVSASNISYYLGPGFTYLNAFLFNISSDPLILAYFGSGLGIVTALSLFYITNRFYGTKAAFFALAFYSGSMFLSYFDRRFWNPTPIMFVSLWFFYCLMRLREDPRYLILLFLLLGLSLHIHLSLLAFWPVTLLIILFNWRSVKLKIWLLSIISWFLVTLPLLVFDFVHNFDNLLMPIRYLRKFLDFQNQGNLTYSFGQFLNTLSRIWYIHPYSNTQDELQLGVHGRITGTYMPLALLSLLIIMSVFILSFSFKKYRLLAALMFSFMLVYFFYPGGVVAYFLLGFLVLFVISIGIFFSKLPLGLAIVLIIPYFLINSYALITSQQEQFGLSTRKKLIKQINPELKGKSFYLETRTTDGRKYHSAGGWRYLFKAYGSTPAQSHADDFFGWIYSDEISAQKPQYRIIVSEYQTIISVPIIKQFSSGVYHAYLVKN